MSEEKDSKNTKRATKASRKVFNEYLQEKNLDEPHHDDKVTLANVLKRFYAENEMHLPPTDLQGSRIVKDLYKSLNTGYCSYNFG